MACRGTSGREDAGVLDDKAIPEDKPMLTKADDRGKKVMKGEFDVQKRLAILQSWGGGYETQADHSLLYNWAGSTAQTSKKTDGLGQAEDKGGSTNARALHRNAESRYGKDQKRC